MSNFFMACIKKEKKIKGKDRAGKFLFGAILLLRLLIKEERDADLPKQYS
jgi:hypothetical protein